MVQALGTMSLMGLAGVASMESAAHARPWEPIETAFDYEGAAFRSGVLVLANFGLVAPTPGYNTRAASPGFHMGSVLGWHLSPRFSLNGEINLAALPYNADTTNGQSDTGFLFDYALSPLFHVGAPNLEFVIGPKLGRYRYSMSDGTYGAFSGSSGWSYGVNLGVLGPLQTMAIGVLVTLTNNHATEICESTCHARDSNLGDILIAGISFAMLH
jgi:hypothetical protein